MYRAFPESLKLCWRDSTWPAERLTRKVDSVALALARQGLEPGSKIAVMIRDPLVFSQLFLASLRAGMIFIPLPPVWKPREVRRAVELISPHLIIADASEASRFENGNPLRVESKSFLKETEGEAMEFLSRGKGEEDVCAILFTSGTTGTLRAVQLTYRNFSASADSWQELLHFTTRDHYLNCLPLYHIGGLSILTRALHYGFSVTFTGAFNARRVNALIDKGEVTLISLVPTMLAKLLEERQGTGFPSGLRAVILGGGPVPPDLLRGCLEADVPAVFTYGMTETCSGIAGWRLEKGSPGRGHRHLKIGRPFKNVFLEAEKGELVIRGPMVMRGYLGEVACRGVHYSGDLGYADDQGDYYLELRREDRIVTGGENVDPREVENVLLKHPLIGDCFVTGRPDERWGQKVVAYVAGKNRQDRGTLTRTELREFCKRHLADFKVPQQFIVLRKIPRNALGKVERKAL